MWDLHLKEGNAKETDINGEILWWGMVYLYLEIFTEYFERSCALYGIYINILHIVKTSYLRMQIVVILMLKIIWRGSFILSGSNEVWLYSDDASFLVWY